MENSVLVELNQKFSSISKLIPSNYSSNVQKMIKFIVHNKIDDKTFEKYINDILKKIELIEEYKIPFKSFINSVIEKNEENSLKILPKIKMIIKKIEEFYQICGELIFFIDCKIKNYEIEKINENNKTKNPDFCINWNSNNYYFEVKTIGCFKHEAQSILRLGTIDSRSETFSYVKNILLKDFDNKKTKESFCNFKKMIDNEILGVLSPTTYEKSFYIGDQLSNINFLIDKIDQNYKEGQYEKENTFLVLNVMIPYLMTFNNNDYSPYYLSGGRLLSGIFWNSAFCEDGMIVGNYNENYNIPTISENRISKQGILRKYTQIKGLIITCFHKDLNENKLHNFYLFRSNEKSEIIISGIVDKYHGWNNSLDANGFRLRK
ncbi:hypothetical protein QSV37_07570 [Acinetobacter sp. VNK23]|uniref:hypothetical protein n=1 Tax=Acinetobacter thutiue TaxID=2998078 RepID=UPI0025753C34|nr:hypothetical protein [Acinetobacter thutiue]MDM1020163.1 hypothetical protein [Acinetobacter thutiue]